MKRLSKRVIRTILVLVLMLVVGIVPMTEPAYAAINGRATLTKAGDNYFTGTYNLNGAEPGTEDGWGNIYFFEDYSTPVKLDATGDITVQITLTGAQNYWELRGKNYSSNVKSLDAKRVNGNWVITIVFPAPSEVVYFYGGVNLYKDDKNTYSGINLNFLFEPNTVANTMTLSSTSGTLTYPNGTTITANNNNGGAITATSNKTSVATVSKIDGNKITITPAAVTKDGETAIITVKSAATSGVKEGTKTYNVTVNRGTFTLTPTPYSGTYDGESHKATIESSIDGVTIVSGPSESYGNTVVNSSTANTIYDLAPFYTNVPGGTIYYQGTRNGYKPVTGSTKVTINKVPAYSKEELKDEQKPVAVEGLEYIGTPGNPTAQALVEAPTAELPEGYDHVEYSIDGGKNWTASLAQGTVNGDYTVKVKYVGDGNHEDFMGDDISVTIDKNDDQKAADEVIAEINELPAELDVETTDRDAIESARSNYEGLTDDQKAWVENNDYSDGAMGKLAAAELGLVKADAIAEVGEYQEEVENSDVYDDQGRSEFAAILEKAAKDIKAATNADAIEKIVTTTKSAIDEVNTKAENDRIAADKVIASIKDNTLEDANNVTTANKDAIEKAKADYDALTDDQKALVDEDAEGTTTKRLNDNLDSLEAAKVEDMIDALLPVKEITAEDKEEVDAARDAYEKLTDDQKAYVDSTRYGNLEKAEINVVKDMIKNLPDYEDVTIGNKEAINAARDAYEKLTEDQKSHVRTSNLEDAEEALAAAEVGAQIAALPNAADVKTTDEEAINAARDAYAALNNAQKDLIDKDTLKHLEEAEEAIPAAKVEDQINELPAEKDVTTDDGEEIEAARKAYEALNDAQKALVDGNAEGETIKKLEAAELGLEKAATKGALETYNKTLQAAKVYDKKGEGELADAETAGKKAIDEATTSEEVKKAFDDAKEAIDKVKTKAENDKDAADAVTEKIKALPSADDVILGNKEAIEAARTAYNALTDDQKELVEEETLKHLTAAEEALAVADVKDMINKLPDDPKDVTLDDKEAIEAARKAYDALNDDQKELVGKARIGKLEDDEMALDVLKVKDQINNLPAADEVTIEDKDDIKGARKAFDALTNNQKKQVGTEAANHLKEAEEALKAALAENVGALIAELPEEGEVTADDKDDIEEAREAFDALSDEEKEGLPEGSKEKLEAAELGLVKAEAKDALDAHKKETEDSDTYDETGKKELADAVDAGKKAIDDAKTPEDIAKALEDAKKEVEDVNTKEENDNEAANDVAGKIAALPKAEDVTTKDKEAIEAAEKAFGDLTDDQKALVDDELKGKLDEVGKALDAAEKEAADQAAADAVADRVAKLPNPNDVTTKDKDAIEAAREALDGLTPEQMAKLPVDTEDKLEANELALAKEEAKEELEGHKKDTEDGDTYDEKGTKELADAEEAGKKAIDDAKTPEEVKKALDDAKKEVEDVNTKAENDKEAADAVADQIAKLPNPNDVTTKDKDAIEAAREALDGLTPDQKALLGPDTGDKLEQNELALAKEEAKEELENHKSETETKDTYDDKGTKELAEAEEAGKKAIDEAKTPEEVAKALDDAKKAVDDVNTKEENEKEAEKPTPVNPTPVNPTPGTDEPVNPTPGTDEPVNPTPGTDEPVNPTPGTDEPVNPTPGTDEPVNPTPGTDEPVNPTPGTNEPVNPTPGTDEPVNPTPGTDEPVNPTPGTDEPVNPTPGTDDTFKIEVAAPTDNDVSDGKITGLDDTMEYSLDGGETWIKVPEGATELEGLEAGTIQVRKAATEDEPASEPIEVEIPKANIVYNFIEEASGAEDNDGHRGNGTDWQKGSEESDLFVFKRNVNDHKTFDEFTGVMVDGRPVDEWNYIAESGSVRISLKPEYLEKLSVGTHTLTAQFIDGDDVNVTFNIIAANADNQNESVKPGKTDGKNESVKPGNANSGTKADSKNANANNTANASSTSKVTKAANTSKAPNTGDATDAASWMVMIALALSCMVYMTERRKMTR